MMPTEFDRLKSFIGIAQKAGKIKSGDAAVLDAIGKRELKLVIMAEDIAESVSAQLAAANKQNIPVICFADKITLGEIIGKSPRGLLGITDEGFAAAIETKFNLLH